jgi:hypothetical protein
VANKLLYNFSEAKKRWQSGDSIQTASLGGISPGYEQCIQILLWELVTQWDGKMPPPENKTYPKKFDRFADKIISELDKKFGFSGAQVGAAKSTAYQFLHYGYEEMMAKLPDDRWIFVSKKFPTLDANPGLKADGKPSGVEVKSNG